MIPPTEIVEFLDVLFDLVKMTISVTPQRLEEIRREVKDWNTRNTYSRVQLKSLLGKLQFVVNCVRPGRVLVLRLHNQLSTAKTAKNIISEQMRKDLQWWGRFLPQYNGVSIMWMQQCTSVDEVFSTDACLTGLGGICGDEYFHAQFPECITTDNRYTIAHLEMVAVLVALKSWKDVLHGKRVQIHCDNRAVVDVIQGGSAKDRLLQDLLREFVYLCAVAEVEVLVTHIFGQNNRIPDLLSRFHLDGKYHKQFEEVKPVNWREILIHEQLFNFWNHW